MVKAKKKIKKKVKLKKKVGPDCPRVRGDVTHLGDYFEISGN